MFGAGANIITLLYFRKLLVRAIWAKRDLENATLEAREIIEDLQTKEILSQKVFDQALKDIKLKLVKATERKTVAKRGRPKKIITRMSKAKREKDGND